MPRPVVRRPFVNKEPKQKTLFDLEPPQQTDEELARELLGDMGGHTQIEGKDTKARIKNVGNMYVKKPTVSLDEYCDLIFNWLLLNPRAFSVLEYYEEKSNQPFEYRLEEVEGNERIMHLLEQRLINLCLTGGIKYGFGTALMANRFGWVTSRTSTEQKPDAPVSDNNNDIKFKFGE